MQTLLALALTALLQDPPAPGATPPAPAAEDPAATRDEASLLEEQLGDGVVAVVGRELIRRDDVYAALRNADFRERIPGLEEAVRSKDEKVRARAVQRVLVELVFDHLMTEGGRNQGYDPAMVAAILERRMLEFQRNVGGAVAASDLLRGSGFDPEAYRVRNEAILLRRTWEESKSGRAPGPTGRKNVDRFVAPGLLRMEYEARLGSPRPEERATLGQFPQRYVLQQVVLGIVEYNGPERAQEIAAAIQSEVTSGKITMEDAARQFTLPRERAASWAIEAMSEAQLLAYSRANYGDAALAEWALAATPGAVSAPFVFQALNRAGRLAPAALVVYRLAEVLEAEEAAPFRAGPLQEQLREELQDGWDRAHVDRGLSDLLEATYVWPAQLHEELLRVSRGGREGVAPKPAAANGVK